MTTSTIILKVMKATTKKIQISEEISLLSKRETLETKQPLTKRRVEEIIVMV